MELEFQWACGSCARCGTGSGKMECVKQSEKQRESRRTEERCKEVLQTYDVRGVTAHFNDCLVDCSQQLLCDDLNMPLSRALYNKNKAKHGSSWYWSVSF